MTSKEIEQKKQKRFSIIEKTLNRLGFYKNQNQYEEMLRGERIIVDYTSDSNDREVITVNYYPKENGRTIAFSKNITITDKCTYIDILATNFSLNM